MLRLITCHIFLFAAMSLLLLNSGVRAQNTGVASINTQHDQAYLALTTADVYIEPGISGIDSQVLQQAAAQGQDDPHTRVDIAILSALPSPYQAYQREQYTGQLHDALGLDKSPLVLVVLGGQRPGVSVWSTALDKDERTQLEKQYAQAIRTNPQAGTALLAQAAASEINGKEYRGTSMILWLVFLVVIITVTGLIVSAGRKKKQAMALAGGPITALRENVLSGIEYLDGYIDVLPKNNPDSDQTRIYRQSASAKYEQAAKILDRATEMTDLNRAQTLLDQAQADVHSARQSLDRATGGTGHIPGDDALRPPILPASQPQVEAIPQNQRGVSFFSGRPAPLSSLVPVTITLGGQSRQVLVTPEEGDELRQGRMPQVLAFQQGGQYQPWYEYNGYDPYRDYWRYENSGWGGLGTGLVAGFVGAELLDGLLSPGYGMGGYSPYAFATDMPAYQSYSDPSYSDPSYADPSYADPTYADPTYAASGYDNSSAGDFSTDNSGNADAQSYDPGDQGAGDFYTDNSSGGDFSGSGDLGGGGDFGGGDSN
ncbi:MAG: hypothetical protein ACRYFS_15060 [Janthinobacterium lividum]